MEAVAKPLQQIVAGTVLSLGIGIAGVVSAESYLLLHADSAERVDQPTWLALQPGFLKHNLKHYPLGESPVLIAVRPSSYTLHHLDFTSTSGIGDERTILFGPEFKVEFRNDTVTYLGDFLSEEGYGTVRQSEETIGKACTQFPDQMAKLKFVVSDLKGESKEYPDVCSLLVDASAVDSGASLGEPDTRFRGEQRLDGEASIYGVLIESFTSAVDSTGKRSLGRLVQVPMELQEGEISVLCDATVLGNGRFRRLMCYTGREGEDHYVDAVQRLDGEARFTPATVNGRRQAVVAQFSVLMSRRGDEAHVSILPNHQEHAGEYGSDYISPQRLFRLPGSRPRRQVWGRWYPVCRHRCERGSFVVFTAMIGIDGKARGTKVVQSSGFSPDDLAFGPIQFARTSFLPGVVNGQTHPMQYTKILAY
jgi:hypothetical protein